MRLAPDRKLLCSVTRKSSNTLEKHRADIKGIPVSTEYYEGSGFL